MVVARSPNGIPVRPIEERSRPIASGHPELADQRERLLGTVADPDLVPDGDDGELLAVRLYEHTPLTRKHLVVAYRETGPTDGFVLTAYFTRRPSARRLTIWTR